MPVLRLIGTLRGLVERLHEIRFGEEHHPKSFLRTGIDQFQQLLECAQFQQVRVVDQNEAVAMRVDLLLNVQPDQLDQQARIRVGGRRHSKSLDDARQNFARIASQIRIDARRFHAGIQTVRKRAIQRRFADAAFAGHDQETTGPTRQMAKLFQASPAFAFTEELVSRFSERILRQSQRFQ